MIPLYIDLDGTLILKDTQWLMWNEWRRKNIKAAYRAYMQRPLNPCRFKQTLWHTIGWKASFNAWMNDPLLEVLHQWHAQGIPLVLATGAYIGLAQYIAQCYPYFSCVVASTPGVNCVGRHKLQAILHRHSVFGYVGNSYLDIPIWKKASWCGVVSPSRGVKWVLKYVYCLSFDTFSVSQKKFIS